MVKIKDGSRINREALEHLRKRAIVLWEHRNKITSIAFDFGVSRQAVHKWVNTYKKKGLDGLKRMKAPGAKPKLLPQERINLLKVIEKTADHYGFETPLWDCKKLRQIILEKFNKKIHPSNIWRFFKKSGITFQKPEREALEKDEEEVERWLKEEWLKIKEHVRRWQAMLYFQDETSARLSPFLGKTWAPKGKTPKIKVTGKRGSICITSAISSAGKMVFRLEKERVKSKQHIEFLKQLIRQHPSRKIIVVEDRAGPHIAKKVKTFVEEHRRRFALYFFPSYSPDLNPDEKVWKYLKHEKLKAHQAKTMEDFRPLLLSKLRSIQRSKNAIKSFFYDSIVN